MFLSLEDGIELVAEKEEKKQRIQVFLRNILWQLILALSNSLVELFYLLNIKYFDLFHYFSLIDGLPA